MRRLSSVATGLLVSATLAGAEAGAQSYAETVWGQLQTHYDFISERNFTPENYVVGRLRSGATDAWNLYFESGGHYVITGACDTDCSDLDLAVLDANGKTLIEDTATDDYPVVEFRPTASGQYTVEVEMYACSVEPCYFGFARFRQ